ncbi:MAG: nucleotidyl transferase AbiEii/AbiGii toxin family protein [Gammaproteobacteria bacterium]|nr:nucleotidyl transferase AbiEii/AbiGii toxin family protein [Gammaproteobacteria bacterium]
MRKKLLKNIEKTVAKSLIRVPGDVRESKGSKFRKTVYQYPRCIDDSGFEQSSPYLLIEVNAFTQPEPFERRDLSTLIAEVLVGKERADLVDRYNLHDFSLNVLSVKRTLAEKVLRSIKDSYHKNPIAELSRQIRHLYDICLIMRKEEYLDFCRNEEFLTLFQQCIEDERINFSNNSECLEKPLSEAPLFSVFETWHPSLESVYNADFSELVYGELPEMDEITNTLKLLKDRLKTVNSQ